MAIRVIVKDTGARLRVRGLTPPGPAAVLAYSNRNWTDRNTWYDLYSDAATTTLINASIYQSVEKVMLCVYNTTTGEITESSSTEYLSIRINGTKLQFTTGGAAINLPTGCEFVVKYTAEEKPTLKLYFKADKSDMTLPKTGWYALYNESGQPATTTESRYVYNCEIYSSSGVLMSSYGKAGAVNGSWTGGNDSGSIIFSASCILIPPA